MHQRLYDSQIAAARKWRQALDRPPGCRHGAEFFLHLNGERKMQNEDELARSREDELVAVRADRDRIHARLQKAEDDLGTLRAAYGNCINELHCTTMRLRDTENELAVLQIAYRNCVNDFNRAKAHSQEAEDTLRAITQTLNQTADHLCVVREDNPGSTGS